MSDAGRKHASFLEIQQPIHILLTGFNEFQFRQTGGKTPLRIQFRHFHQAVEAVPGMMEARYGFHDVVRIHVTNQILEGPKGKSCLVGLAGVFHHVVGVRAGQVVVTAPDAITGDVNVVASSPGRVEVEGLAGGIFQAAQDFPVDVTRDFFHIAHDGFGVFEDVIVDALEDIGIFRPVAFTVGGLVSGVDVPAGDFLPGDEFPFNGEEVSNSGDTAQKLVGSCRYGERGCHVKG